MAGRTDTVVKARYSRGLSAAIRLAKAHVRYGVHRPDEHGLRQYRELWDRDGRLSKQAAYARLDGVGHSDFIYRLTLSPHPERQDAGHQLDLRAWTRDMLAQLERDAGERVEWFAVTHEHRDHRHGLSQGRAPEQWCSPPSASFSSLADRADDPGRPRSYWVLVLNRRALPFPIRAIGWITPAVAWRGR